MACCRDDGQCDFMVGDSCGRSCEPIADACPAGDGTAAACCEFWTEPFDGTTTPQCGFDYGGGCVFGEQLRNDCDLARCPTPSPYLVEATSCCPSGADARCGVGCGAQFGGYYHGMGQASSLSPLPTGCVALGQPGTPTTDCPSTQIYEVWSDARWGGSSTEIQLPGCRRADGRCGVWYDLLGLGCINPDLLRSWDQGAQCPLRLAGSGDEVPGDCLHDTDCASGSCGTPDADPGWCTAGAAGEGCGGDTQCASGICSSDGNYPGTCTTGANGEPCNVDGDCTSGRCADDSAIFDGHCTGGEVGDSCADDADCVNGHCVEGSVLGPFGPSGPACRAGVNGDPCDAPEDCGSGFCVASLLFLGPPFNQTGPALCTSGEGGATCIADTDCLSGHCTLSLGAFSCDY